jgi:hypothetical protein
MDRKILKELSELNNRLAEDRMYEIAVDEIENNDFDKVAQAIAFEEAEGDEKKARAFYTKHRVRRIKDEITYFVTELAATIEAEAKRSAEQNKVRKIEARKNSVKEIGVKTAKGFWYIFFFIGVWVLFVPTALAVYYKIIGPETLPLPIVLIISIILGSFLADKVAHRITK